MYPWHQREATYSLIASRRNTVSSSTPALQHLIVAHAVVCVLGFALLLPLGALFARYFRTFTTRWYTGHWIAQDFLTAGPVIVVGVVLGFAASGMDQLEVEGDVHKRLGIVTFGIYLIQCGTGTIIHYFKPRNATGRPVQNYGHAILGIGLIALAMYVIHTGYDEAWVIYTGLRPLPSGVNSVWISWCIVRLVHCSLVQIVDEEFPRCSCCRYFMVSGSFYCGSNTGKRGWLKPNKLSSII
ncbi:hypothetical protein C8J57DRAFT_1181088 [Mycena rebaudengoi]|nr:hypothetical protein C8J57DRAFT_1181088 [Mycena rebaudengoi]